MVEFDWIGFENKIMGFLCNDWFWLGWEM